jgi:hypothetical protein
MENGVFVDKFGPNGDQVERFIEAADDLPFEIIEKVSEEIRSKEYQLAEDEVFNARFSAARHSAVESAARNLIRDLRLSFPMPATTRERGIMNDFSEMVRSAVFALAARPELDDATVGTLVDPFASRLNFEWRSRGVSTKSEGEAGLG